MGPRHVFSFLAACAVPLAVACSSNSHPPVSTSGGPANVGAGGGGGGSGGAADGGAVLLPDGAVADVNPACGPQNCSGCCDATGTCQTGSTLTVCGSGGNVCTDCSASNQTCVSGQCQ
jgi:hypothetical protein